MKIICIVSLIIICYAGIAMAHDECDKEGGDCGKEEEGWSPVSAGPVTTQTAPLCGRAKFVIQPFLFYNHTRGSFDLNYHYSPLSKGDYKYQLQEQLFAQYGLTDRVEIDAQTVYQENYAKRQGIKAHSDGFGDSYLFARYCAFEEKGWMPHITGLFQLKMPTGRYQHLDPDKLGTDLMGAASGAGSWDQGVGIIMTKKLKPFVLHSDLIYSFPQEVRVDGVKTRYANYLNCDFAIEYFLPEGFNLMLEANGFLQGNKNEDSQRIPDSGISYLTVAPGIGWSDDKIQMLLAYQRVALGKNTDADDSVVFTCVYTF